jgi:hypothetical protein
MKTKEQLQSALDDLQSVCARHGIVLIGVCDAEGIYGEILICEPDVNFKDRISNALDDLGSGEFSVTGIGGDS